MPVLNYYSLGGQIVGEKPSGGNRRDYLTDALGSVVGTVTSTGAVENTYRYKPYGGLLARTGVASDPSFLWVGSQGYRQTGKKYSDVYVRARHYSSDVGRWTTRDPIGYDDGWNQYGYVQGNPILLGDPSGKQAISPVGCCGPLVDQWIVPELRAQFTGLAVYKGTSASLSVYDYARWALTNQRYKCDDYFDFTAGHKCATRPDPKKHGCKGTVRLCGKCLRTSTLGNIMFGFVGIHAGHSSTSLANYIKTIKKRFHKTIDPYDAIAYEFGLNLYDRLNGGKFSPPLSINFDWQTFCRAFKFLVTVYPNAFYESDVSGGYINYDSCTACQGQNTESRHGGSEPPATSFDIFNPYVLGCGKTVL